MNPQTWNQFRAQLFTTIDERRSKVAHFKFEKMYFFISYCSKLFASPGTKEAGDALDAICDEGTFLLVADSLTSFLELFPTAETDEDTNNQNGLRPSADRDVVRAIPEAQQMGVRKATPQSPVRSQANTDARRGSGRPF